jgi:hypothetical protein
LLADTSDDFAQQLLRLIDPACREMISTGASEQAARLFSQDRFDSITRTILDTALSTRSARPSYSLVSSGL